MSCNCCGTPTGTFLLHGSPTALAAAHEASFTCTSCELSASFEIPASFFAYAGDSEQVRCDPTWRKRKNGRPSGPGTIACSACIELLGVGGVRLVDADAVRERIGKVIWIDPEFDVEAVCTSCFENVSFCTETPSETFEAVSTKHDPKTLLSLLKSRFIHRHLSAPRQRVVGGGEVGHDGARGRNEPAISVQRVDGDVGAKEQEAPHGSGTHPMDKRGGGATAPEGPERRAALIGIANCELNPSRGMLHIWYSVGNNITRMHTSIALCVKRILAEPRGPDQPPLQYLWLAEPVTSVAVAPNLGD
ncbi:hypothetical protein BDK51DRAFT_38377 [Blyttiomyces helicus]|uniref:Uncharacterized protein n=1 Tax=Blyttiomyces helicus TaxID=388810 RepID=A0A4P9VWX0_9FUNG|nr:hypothetical protein BDK51DRAFT_38377 [Blyttiomyces helicus]|eukprot:RKO82758.1 hypothetical protein BDK51DRAFT_38377 [Blyttiomyces helicus]